MQSTSTSGFCLLSLHKTLNGRYRLRDHAQPDAVRLHAEPLQLDLPRGGAGDVPDLEGMCGRVASLRISRRLSVTAVRRRFYPVVAARPWPAHASPGRRDRPSQDRCVRDTMPTSAGSVAHISIRRVGSSWPSTCLACPLSSAGAFTHSNVYRVTASRS